MNGYDSLSLDDPRRWYALYTRSRFEYKVREGLAGKSLEAFLPQIQVMSRRKDRHRKIFVPMIPGYVFVRSTMAPEEYHRIIRTPGVVRMVCFEGTPAPVNDQEISSLMILDGTDRTVQNRAFLRKGERVVIMQGPFAGLVGIYQRRKGQKDKVVVSVELLKRSLAVEIDDWLLEKLV
ncbi:MAG: UpxY family transcription antiterminator [Desulfobacteraceae bacterium]|nr:MAG: UpxY family transcription antiterminator [Desulfobacteraceae bacterium]